MKSHKIILQLVIVLSCFALHSIGQTVSIKIQPTIVNPQFGGVGFHVFYQVHNAP